jgi:pyruvate/2-oxoacid:ferredoxin oxidoreductase beta subunit
LEEVLGLSQEKQSDETNVALWSGVVFVIGMSYYDQTDLVSLVVKECELFGMTKIHVTHN